MVMAGPYLGELPRLNPTNIANRHVPFSGGRITELQQRRVRRIKTELTCQAIVDITIDLNKLESLSQEFEAHAS